MKSNPIIPSAIALAIIFQSMAFAAPVIGNGEAVAAAADLLAPLASEITLEGDYYKQNPNFLENAKKSVQDRQRLRFSKISEGRQKIQQLMYASNSGLYDRYLQTIAPVECPIESALGLAMKLPYMLGWTHGCKIAHGVILTRDPIDGSDARIQIKVFQPKDFNGADPSQVKTVILMPPTGGETPFDDMTSEDLADHGFQVVVLDEWDHGVGYEMDITKYDEASERTLWAITRAVRFIEEPARRLTDQLRQKNPKAAAVKAGPIGIMGTSVGAIGASVAYGAIPELKAAYLVLAGGNMPEIIGRSQQPGLASLRSAREISYDPKNNYNTDRTNGPVSKHDPRLQFDGQQDKRDPNHTAYVNVLSQVIAIDPLDFATCDQGSDKARNLMMVRGTEDVTVPTLDQDQLFAAWTLALTESRQCANPDKLPMVAHRDNFGDHIPTIVWAEAHTIGRMEEWFRDHLQ